MRSGRRAGAHPLAALGALVVAALVLGGCEQLKSLGEMVGLGGGEPAPAEPVPAPPRAAGGPKAPPAAAATPVAPAAPAAAAAAPSAAPLAAGKPGGPTTTPGQAPALVAGPATAASPGPAAATPATAGAPAQPATASAARGAGSPAAGLPDAGDAYDPRGRRDPFQPYVTAADLEARKNRPGLSPLQQLEVTQLRLVAIVWGLNRNHAMVQDPAGIGYVLRTGTKVGLNGGRVRRIAPDAVYIEESFRDSSGAVQTNEVVLRLPRSAGGKGS